MHEFFGVNLLCNFRGDVVFSPMWSHVNENEKKKSKMQNFDKQKKWSGDRMKRYLSTKFGINLPDGFGENGFYGRWTDDGRLRDDISSSVQ